MQRPFFWMATAGALLSVGTVSAQTTPAAEGGLEEVVVTGVRQSLENAIETKRDAAAVVDAISAEDVGKFPTENLAGIPAARDWRADQPFPRRRSERDHSRSAE